ncbi:hypothetical protein ACLOJK_035633 [Asimina triloba]
MISLSDLVLKGQSKCTVTGFHTVENRQKPLFLKELRKLWDKEEPDLPWEKGDYGPANTLLLDDSPYKALRNPVNIASFWCPGGDLRVYLEGIAMADDVPHYVERHPFGQRAITDTNPSWSFYLQITVPAVMSNGENGLHLGHPWHAVLRWASDPFYPISCPDMLVLENCRISHGNLGEKIKKFSLNRSAILSCIHVIGGFFSLWTGDLPGPMWVFLHGDLPPPGSHGGAEPAGGIYDVWISKDVLAMIYD